MTSTAIVVGGASGIGWASAQALAADGYRVVVADRNSKDGSAWTSGQCRQRVIRGGSFANKSNTATSAARFRYDLDVRYFANGFRVVRDVQ